MTDPLRIKNLDNTDTETKKEFLRSYGEGYLRLWIRTKAWEDFLLDHSLEWEAYQDSVSDANPDKRLD